MNIENNTNPGIRDQISRARAFSLRGDFTNAEKILNTVLANNGKDPEALGMLATMVYLRGDKKHAKKLWKQSLASVKRPEVFLTNLHEFLVAQFKDNNREGAIKQAKQKLPDWPAGKIPNDKERNTLIGLANMLAKLDLLDSARQILKNLVQALPQDHKVKAAYGLILMMQSEYEAALKIFTEVDQAIKPKDDISLLSRICQCALMLDQEELTTPIRHRVAEICPVFVTPERKGQAKNVLIVVHHPVFSQTIFSERDLFGYANYMSQIAKTLENEFHFSFAFSCIEDLRRVHQLIPEPDLIINSMANAEWLIHKDDSNSVARFLDSFKVPVINHPAKAVKTTRDHAIELIKDIPCVIVPNTISFDTQQKSIEELADEIEDKFTYPFIVRTLFKQEGKGMVKVDDRDTFENTLYNTPNKVYVTKFIDCLDESGFYRKIRAAIVGNELHIVRVDYDTQWNVHGRKSEERAQLYLDHPELLETEKRICSNPETELGLPVMQALEEIRKRIPLEIFGIDFDVTKDGEILFFEANATMNLLSTAHSSVPYPAGAEEHLLSSFRRFFNNVGDS